MIGIHCLHAQNSKFWTSDTKNQRYFCCTAPISIVYPLVCLNGIALKVRSYFVTLKGPYPKILSYMEKELIGGVISADFQLFVEGIMITII